MACPHGPDTERYKDGRCKACSRARSVAWSKANREKVCASNAAWRKANPARHRASNAAWSKANPEKVRAQRAASNRTIATRFSCAQSAAKRRKKEWHLTLEQYSEAVCAPCAYCKNMLDLPAEVGVGLDRLDNTQGYVPGNVVACCETCNRIRSNYLSPDETRVAVQAILRYRALGAESAY